MSWRLGAYARRVISGKRRLPRRVVERGRARFFNRQINRYGDRAYDELMRGQALGVRMGWRAPVPLPAGIARPVAFDEGRARWMDRRGWELLPYDRARRETYRRMMQGAMAVDQRFLGDLTEVD